MKTHSASSQRFGKTATRHPWLASYLAHNRKLLLSALALGVLNIACSTLLMFASGALIGKCAQPETTLLAIMMPMAFVQLFGLGKPASRYFERLISHDWVFRIASDLRRALYAAAEKSTDLGASPHDRSDSNADESLRPRTAGNYLGLLAEDIGHLQNLFLRVGLPWAIALIATLLVAIAFGIYTPWFGCVMFCALATASILVPLCALLASKADALRQKQLVSSYYDTLLDTIVGSRDWVLAGRSAECREACIAKAHELGNVQHTLHARKRLLELIVKLLFGCLALAVTWWAATHFSSTNANLVIAFAIGFMPLIDAFIGLPDASTQYHAHADALERLDAALGYHGESDSPASASTPTVESPRIRLENVSFSYADGKQVLDDITIDIPAGQSVALLGRSGVGKSTLLALMRAGLPANSVGTIEQNAHIFDASLRENITLGREGFSDDQVVEALTYVGLGEFVADRENGLDALVGEAGMRLSGGQRQRVALARVLLSDTPVVLLDEPTQSLDPHTEHNLVESLFATLEGKTVVMATHHLQEIDRFDRIVFLEGGRIALDGSPATLMAESPLFRTLARFDIDAIR